MKDKTRTHGLRKDLTKEQIKHAMSVAFTVPGASRYLKCSAAHLRKWMKFYDSPTHENMFEEYKNHGAKGLKRTKSMRNEPNLMDLLNGIIDISNYPVTRIRYRLCEEGLLEEKCSNCGFCERRITDMRMPLILTFKDKNKKNWKLENLELNCYNCYFLIFDDVYNDYDILSLEGHYPVRKTTELSNLELDDYMLEHIEEIAKKEAEKKETMGDYDILAFKYEKDKKQIQKT